MDDLFRSDLEGVPAEPSRTPAATELPLRPLSVRYHGAPVSRLYRPGFAVDSAACGEDGSGRQLVVAVHSAPQHRDLRAAVRHTWGSLGLRSDAALVFLLGESPDPALASQLRREALAYGDIVVSRNLDTYDNLTLKTVAMAEWVSLRCPGARFFLKTDDDVFINVPRLLEFLRRPEVSTANRTVFGGMTRGTHPIRDRSHRHYISEEEYPGDVFVDYMQGACYLVTGDLSRDLYRVSLQESFFRMEDIFFTGLMAERVGANKVY
ncbi:lactosylceramide 1,3-N-acetyl-beta-D-glucosaminyltransferase-like [Bacillus rossius redtenbacheri]|uniref:lactosylceramide 1,3-N-acetyl-beta-D-glucosaminyltransferase-like n=1 Tax=Bacillus rossius redtenbacheri TaxID=93214 RepID=UPI002FDCF1A5